MSIVITVVIVTWFASAVIRSAEVKKQEKRRQRIEAEQKRQRDELRQQREDAKAWARQQVEIQREQIRIAREQERQAREIEKHEAWLVKHDEEIEKLKFCVSKAESDIGRLKEKVNELYALLDIEENKLAACANGSNEQVKHQKKVITYRDQIHAAEQKLAKAQFDRANAERKLRAA